MIGYHFLNDDEFDPRALRLWRAAQWRATPMIANLLDDNLCVFPLVGLRPCLRSRSVRREVGCLEVTPQC